MTPVGVRNMDSTNPPPLPALSVLSGEEEMDNGRIARVDGVLDEAVQALELMSALAANNIRCSLSRISGRHIERLIWAAEDEHYTDAAAELIEELEGLAGEQDRWVTDSCPASAVVSRVPSPAF